MWGEASLVYIGWHVITVVYLSAVHIHSGMWHSYMRCVSFPHERAAALWDVVVLIVLGGAAVGGMQQSPACIVDLHGVTAERFVVTGQQALSED